MHDDPIESLRSLCTALPEVEERLSHSEPTWFIRGKKVFVMLSNHHHDDRLAFWCAAPEGAQEMLVESARDQFFALRTSDTVAGWVFTWTCPWTGMR